MPHPKSAPRQIRREFYLLGFTVLLLGLALSPGVRQWRTARAQHRLYVRNQSPVSIATMQISFLGYDSPAYGNKPHILRFRGIPSQGEQWQLFGSKWGNGDSSRWIEIRAVTSSGERLRWEKELHNVEDPVVNVGLGARFYVTLSPTQELRVQPNE